MDVSGPRYYYQDMSNSKPASVLSDISGTSVATGLTWAQAAKIAKRMAGRGSSYSTVKGPGRMAAYSGPLGTYYVAA